MNPPSKRDVRLTTVASAERFTVRSIERAQKASRAEGCRCEGAGQKVSTDEDGLGPRCLHCGKAAA